MRPKIHCLPGIANASGWLRGVICAASLMLFASCGSQHFNSFPNIPEAEAPLHILLIGVDGMSALGIDQANTPNLDWLKQNGAYTGKANAVLPTKSSPNWMSMLTGATVEQHGVTSNSWNPNKQSITPECVNDKGTFLDIFSWLRKQKPEIHQACFYDWADFGRLFDWSGLNSIQHFDNAAKNARNASRYFCKEKPDFMFVHLDHVDHKLHAMGFGSKAYLRAIEKADRLIGNMIADLKAAGIFDKTVILVSADHGGKGRNHGGDTPQEVQIPLYLFGPGIKKQVLEEQVMIYDIPATVLQLFQVSKPDCWTGTSVDY